MVLQGEAMRLVPDSLEEMQLWRVSGPVVASIGRDHQFLVFRQGDRRNRPTHIGERLAGRRKLTVTAVDHQ